MNYKFTALLIILICLLAIFGGPKHKPEENFIIPLPKPKEKNVVDEVRDGDLILAIPSNGIHSNGYSLVRKLLVGKTVTAKMKNEIIKPTKIYSNEILKASERKLISAAANITGGGITENIVRSIPDNYTANIDLSKIRICVKNNID